MKRFFMSVVSFVVAAASAFGGWIEKWLHARLDKMEARMEREEARQAARAEMKAQQLRFLRDIEAGVALVPPPAEIVCPELGAELAPLVAGEYLTRALLAQAADLRVRAAAVSGTLTSAHLAERAEGLEHVAGKLATCSAEELREAGDAAAALGWSS